MASKYKTPYSLPPGLESRLIVLETASYTTTSTLPYEYANRIASFEFPSI
jgi:hypothetical protein